MMRMSFLLVILLQPISALTQEDLTREEHLMSSLGIVGFDPKTGEVGVACASRVFAVGYVMAHVRAGVGAVALMGGAPYKDGQLMLDWMEEGASLQQVTKRLRNQYSHIGQMSLVDVTGETLAVTENPNLSDWYGQRFGLNYAASGNILVGPEVIDGFADTFESTEGLELTLSERLMMALEKADQAGGDARGRMGAVIKVYKPSAGYRETELYLDLRVDDSPHAIDDLRYLYERWKEERLQQYGSRMILQTQGADVARLQEWLVQLGYADPDNLAIFDVKRKPTGIFNDATVDAVLAFKREYDLGTGRNANRETVVKMIEILKNRVLGLGTASFWK